MKKYFIIIGILIVVLLITVGFFCKNGAVYRRQILR